MRGVPKITKLQWWTAPLVLRGRRIVAVQLGSRTYDPADIHAMQELYHSNGWTDGLPVVPPTPDSVAACLEWTGMLPDHLIGVEPVRFDAAPMSRVAV